jgi:cytochrome c biogenesis protein CcmG/thiol:disulfide interchange protein DsbE
MAEPTSTKEPKVLAAKIPSILWVGVGIVVAALLVYGFLSSGSSRPAEGEVAPPFTLALFDDSWLTLSELRGQVVVLNFWASWCAPCRREAPALREMWERYRDQGVVFVGVTYLDAPEASQAFIEEFGLGYANGIDQGRRISRAYGVAAVPETFVIDREGHVAAVRVGEIEAEDLVQILDPLLNQ